MKKKKGCLQTILKSIAVLVIVFGILFWGLTATYYGVSISPNGETLVVTTPYSVTMYSIKYGIMLHREFGKPYGSQDYQGEFSYIAWSPDGSCLAVGELYNGVWVWDTKNWKLLTESAGEQTTRKEPSFAWSPDGQQLALGKGNGDIWIWNKQENVWKIKANGLTNLHSITWTANGQLLALQGWNIYDVETGKLVSRLNHYIDGSGKVSWSPDGSHVYIFFDLGGGVMDMKANEYEFSAGYFPRFAWSKSGQYFAAVEESSNEIYVWDTINNKVVRQEKQGVAIYALTWTPNDELLALGIKDIRTMVWNTNTGEVIKTMLVPPNPLFYLFRYLPE